MKEREREKERKREMEKERKKVRERTYWPGRRQSRRSGGAGGQRLSSSSSLAKFRKFSALVPLLCKSTIERTFQNVCLWAVTFCSDFLKSQCPSAFFVQCVTMPLEGVRGFRVEGLGVRGCFRPMCHNAIRGWGAVIGCLILQVSFHNEPCKMG